MDNENIYVSQLAIELVAGIDLRVSIVHTGQHYDPNMSDIFLRELGIPAPPSGSRTSCWGRKPRNREVDVIGGIRK